MDNPEMLAQLETRLANLDWQHGLTKAALTARLTDDTDLRAAIEQQVPDGTYFSTADVLAIMASPVSATATEAMAPNQLHAESTRARGDHVTDGEPTIGGRAKQTVAQTRDQVLSISTQMGAAARSSARAADRPDQLQHRLVAVGLSALVEGLGQAYNRQPAKAVGMAAAGIGLSTASGLNTWLARHLLRLHGAKIGAERINPVLLGLWAVAYVVNLWDAWRGTASGAQPPLTWDDLTLDQPAAASAAAVTDHFPVVNPS